MVLQEDVEDINQERLNVAATNKRSTGIINITKTGFYKKRKENSQSRTLNITHHALVNPTSHLTKYYYGSRNIRKTMELVKQASGNFEKLKVNGVIIDDFVQRELANILDTMSDLKHYRDKLPNAKVETQKEEAPEKNIRCSFCN